MDDEMYILYNFRRGGWLQTSGTLSSDWKKAAWWSRDEALEIARRHREYDGLTCAPVQLELMEKLAA